MTLLLGYRRVPDCPFVEVEGPASFRISVARDTVTVIDDKRDHVRVCGALNLGRNSEQHVGSGIVDVTMPR